MSILLIFSCKILRVSSRKKWKTRVHKFLISKHPASIFFSLVKSGFFFLSQQNALHFKSNSVKHIIKGQNTQQLFNNYKMPVHHFILILKKIKIGYSLFATVQPFHFLYR